MTRFTKQNLIKDGQYITYQPTPDSREDEKFVARFKRGGAATFMTHLRKNWTVEDYFSRLDTGESPLPIAESTGYLLPHIKRWLKKGGYPLSQVGFKQMIQDQVESLERSA